MSAAIHMIDTVVRHLNGCAADGQYDADPGLTEIPADARREVWSVALGALEKLPGLPGIDLGKPSD